MMSERDKATELFRTKFVATLLLVVATIVFVVSARLEERARWLGFVRATSEAAMVGAIADWFAVTALFRHPLGLKIPHTAIIPTHKQKIAEGFGQFVRAKFLTQEIILQKLHTMEVTRRAAEWISQPQNSAQVAEQMVNAMGAASTVIRDQEVQAIIERWLASEIRSTSLAPKVGQLLELVLASPRRQEILYGLGSLGLELLRENRDVVESSIRNELPGLLRGVARPLYDRIERAVDAIVREANADPTHPLNERIDTAVRQVIAQLQHSPDVRAREAEIKEAWLNHPAFREFTVSLWADLKAALVQREKRSNEEFRLSLQKILAEAGEVLLHDPALLAKVDRWVNGLVVYVVETYGYELESLISNTINSWDAEQASHEIELQVGKDLQFIRLNGTVIGGLVGLVIYGVSMLLKL